MKLFHLWSLGVVVLGVLVGCEAPGVGDPCTPEQVPEGGFVRTEAYLETSSVQCRTRVCMVYRLGGDPRVTVEEGCNASNCITNQERDERVYCTCRCAAPAGSNTTLCECPDGFTCTEILQNGGIGIQGSYCVRSTTVSTDT